MTVSEDDYISSNFISIIPYTTLRIRQTQLPVEEHASAIASHLQLSKNLMQNDPVSEQLRIETLRAMPQSLTIKKSVKHKLQIKVNRKARKSISIWKRLVYMFSLMMRKLYVVLQNSGARMKLCHQSIKSIEGHFGSGTAAYFKFLRWLIMLNVLTCIVSTIFIVLPQSLDNAYSPSHIRSSDFLTGIGSLENTIMYYGFYSNGTVGNALGIVYNIPLAYLITNFCIYILIFIMLSAKIMSSYRKCYINLRGKITKLYSNKIFCGWDWGISTIKAANLQSAFIHRDLTELLNDIENKRSQNYCRNVLITVMKCVVTIIIFVLACGIVALMWTLLNKYDSAVDTNSEEFLSTMFAPITVTVIMHTYPVIISWLAKWETYGNARTQTYITIIRIHIVAAIVITTWIVFWLIINTSTCWQTQFAAQIYRLILLDFIICTFGSLFVEFTYIILRKTVWKDMKKTKFDVAHNSLLLIYNQVLFWLGYYFCPLMPAIIVIKMLLMFYIKKFVLLKFCDPLQRSWRAAQTETLFLALTFLGMVGVIVTLGYVITNIQSNHCGPFKEYLYVWDFIMDEVLALKRESVFWSIVTELMRPATGAVILIGMSIGVYWLRAKVKASKEMLHILQEMLHLQSRDKEYLLSSISKVAGDCPIRNTNCTPSGGGNKFQEQSSLNRQGNTEHLTVTRRRQVDHLPSTSHIDDKDDI